VTRVEGGDAALAAAVRDERAVQVRFVPDDTSDVARALGLPPGVTTAEVVELDVLDVNGQPVVNMAVFGVAPDRLRWFHRARAVTVEIDDRVAFDGAATTVVIANGEYLRGNDLVPRGHPGDGRFEVHVYALDPSQRGRMRTRLGTGTHLPHPGIRTAQGRRTIVRWAAPTALELDGRSAGDRREAAVAIRPGALTIVP
jgi:diacylglycerol kinase family enzyme